MLKIKKPNLNAPRYRVERTTLLDESFFRKFRRQFPKYKELSDSSLREIIETYNELLWNAVINTRDGVEFPETLGYVFIGTCPSPKKFNVDYRLSTEVEQRVRHRNFESDNYLAKIFYTNFAIKYKFQHRDLWQFEANRKFSRAVSASYPDNWKMYLQVDNMKSISKIFHKSKQKEWAIKNTPVITEEYNEFEI
mgnify:CR=1 FL=1